MIWTIAICIALFLAWCALPNLATWLANRPRPYRCRNCKSTRLYHFQDGGHDYVEECLDCGAMYGVQDSPFDIVERIR